MKCNLSKIIPNIGLLIVVLYPILGRWFIRSLPLGLEGRWIFWLGLNLLVMFGLLYLSRYIKKKMSVQSTRKKQYKVAIMILGFFALLAWAMVVQTYFPKTQNETLLATNLNQVHTYFRYVLVAVICVIAPIYEEIIFRYLVMKRFVKQFSDIWSIFLSATLFSLGHLRQLSVTDFMTYFVMGLIFAGIYRHTQSIYYSMTLHIIWNSLPYIVYFLVFVIDLITKQ
ncbi:lysostaphin resistance A-like protein [Streptococcus sp. E17BB]|uniref:CPBP family intramembrane glutamic endopeptidase n=1 Tax=Streptococcus sp. E17BB TaxID=3278714 RepID=UPI00359D4C84